MPWYVAFEDGPRTGIIPRVLEDKEGAIRAARRLNKRGFSILEIGDMDETTIDGDALADLIGR